MRGAYCCNIRRIVQSTAAVGQGSFRTHTACGLGRAVRRQTSRSIFSKQLFCSTAAGVAEAPVKDDASPETPAVDISQISLLVGKILSIEDHPDADDLYVEQIDVGEAEPRTICSGLRKFYNVEDLQGKSVVVVSNQRPRKLRGISSDGYLLCASNDEHTDVQILMPPEGAAPGERIFFGEGNEDQPPPATPNQVHKKKMWTKLQPLLKTNGDKVPCYDGFPMWTTAGPVQSSLADANIS